MKKFNLKLITPLILTLILQGCMPDSLTKFKKDPPKKTTTSASATATGVSGSSSTMVAPTSLSYTQTDKLLFKLSNTTSLGTNIETSPYVRSGLLTSSAGITGVVKYIDTTNSYALVSRVIPITLADATGFVKDDFIYSSLGAIGKIQKVSGNIVYVERLTSSINFTAADGVIHSTVYPGVYAGPATTAIASIDSAYVFDASVTALDNDEQFYTTNYNQTVITQLYEKGSVINPIAPIASSQISTANGITFSISPALPSGLSFNTTTGEITGLFNNTLPSTKFTITASNTLGSTSIDMYLSSVEAIKDLSYTRRELITVATNSSFNEGEYLFQPLTPPLTESTTGRVLRKYSTNQMSITTKNGQFLEGASIDSGNAYYAAKTTVLANPIFYNIALTVSDASTFTASTSTVSSYAWSSSGAGGRVMAIDAASKTLFIQYLNTSATPTLFNQNDKIVSLSLYPSTVADVTAANISAAASTVTIDQVEADNMKLTLSSVVGINQGDELTAALSGTLTGDLSAYIHKISGSNVYVSDISRRDTQSQYFRVTQDFDHDENMLVNRGSLTAVANDNFFIVDRGAKAEIESNVSQGSGATFTISPALPTGLSLNSSTGVISGTPTVPTARTSYTVTSKNFISETKSVFELEVRDYFELGESIGAPSILFHKYGDSRGARKCRINATDIKNFSAGGTVTPATLDIRCFLDAEEQDLHFNKLKLLASAGAGVCEYVQVYPYSFWQYAPTQTASAYTYVNGCDATVSGAPGPDNVPTPAPDAATLCAGNYTAASGPNCDEGSVTVTTYTWSMDAVPSCTIKSAPVVTTLSCGGVKTNCLKGPVRDILSDVQIAAGSRSLIYSSSSGAALTSTFSAPIDTLDSTNLRVANGTVNNKCLSTNSDADTWASTQKALANTDNPFAGGNSTLGANPFYVINCLDAAKDVKARIRVVVRDWNKTFKVKDGIDLDLPGPADLMNNTAVVGGKNNNDYSDWDDSYNGAAVAPGVGGTCAVPAFTSNYKFPGATI